MGEEEVKSEDIELVDIRCVIEYESAEEILDFVREYPEVWKDEFEQRFAVGFFTGYRECLTRLMNETDSSQSRNLAPVFFERDGAVHALDVVITTSKEGYLKWWEEKGKHRRGEWLEDIKRRISLVEQEE